MCGKLFKKIVLQETYIRLDQIRDSIQIARSQSGKLMYYYTVYVVKSICNIASSEEIFLESYKIVKNEHYDKSRDEFRFSNDYCGPCQWKYFLYSKCTVSVD